MCCYSEYTIRAAGDLNIIDVNLKDLSDLQYWQQIQNTLRTKPSLFGLFINNLISIGQAIGEASGRFSNAMQWEDIVNSGLEIFVLNTLINNGYNVKIIDEIGYRTFFVERNGIATIIPPVLRRDQINDYLRQITLNNPNINMENVNISIIICEGNHYYLIVRLVGQNKFERYNYLSETNRNCWSCSANSLLNLASSFGIDVFNDLNLSSNSLKIMSISPKNTNTNPLRRLDEPITITFGKREMSTTYINYKNQINSSKLKQTNGAIGLQTVRDFIELYGLETKFSVEELQWLENYFVPDGLADYIINLILKVEDTRQWFFDNINFVFFSQKNFNLQKSLNTPQPVVTKQKQPIITKPNIRQTNNIARQMTIREFLESLGVNQEKYSDYLLEFENYYVIDQEKALRLIEKYLDKYNDKVIMIVGEEINNKNSTIFQKKIIEPINCFLSTETDTSQPIITKPNVNNSNKFNSIKKCNNFAKQYISKNSYNTESNTNIQKPVISQPPVTPNSSEETTINARELANNLEIADYFDNSDFYSIGNISMTEVEKISEIVNGIREANINQCNGRNYPTIESKYAIVLLFYITSQVDIGVLQQRWKINNENMGTLVNTVISIYHGDRRDYRIPNIMRSSANQRENKSITKPTITKPMVNKQNKDGCFIC